MEIVKILIENHSLTSVICCDKELRIHSDHKDKALAIWSSVGSMPDRDTCLRISNIIMSGQDYKISSWAGERHDNLGVTLEYNVKLDDSFNLSRKLNKIFRSMSVVAYISSIIPALSLVLLVFITGCKSNISHLNQVEYGTSEMLSDLKELSNDQ